MRTGGYRSTRSGRWPRARDSEIIAKHAEANWLNRAPSLQAGDLLAKVQEEAGPRGSYPTPPPETSESPAHPVIDLLLTGRQKLLVDFKHSP